MLMDTNLETTRRELWEKEFADLTNQRNTKTERRNNLMTNIANYAILIEDNKAAYEFHSGEAARYETLLDE